MYIPSGKCKGMCMDVDQRVLAYNIVLDKSKRHVLPAADKDVGSNGQLQAIPIQNGRSIYRSPGLPLLVMTDYCICVCCYEFGRCLMRHREANR